MISAAEDGALSIDKIEAMTCVRSVSLYMIAVPGGTRCKQQKHRRLSAPRPAAQLKR